MLYVHSQHRKSFCFVEYIAVCSRCILFSYFRGNHRGKRLVYSAWGFVAHSPSCCQKQMELRDRFLACSLHFYMSCWFCTTAYGRGKYPNNCSAFKQFHLYPGHGASWRWDRASYVSRQSSETFLSHKRSSSSWVPLSPELPSHGRKTWMM